MPWLLCIGRLVSKTDNVMHFARLVEQASATRFSQPIGLSQTWSITDLVATYLSLELTWRWIVFIFCSVQVRVSCSSSSLDQCPFTSSTGLEHCLFLQFFGRKLTPVPVSNSHWSIHWTSVDLHTGSGLKLKLEQETQSWTEAYSIHCEQFHCVRIATKVFLQ